MIAPKYRDSAMQTFADLRERVGPQAGNWETQDLVAAILTLAAAVEDAADQLAMELPCAGQGG